MPRVVMELELDKLIISSRNVRKDPGDLSELTGSVESLGVLEPILARPKGDIYEVIAGGRRLEAARKAGLKTITVVVVEVSDTEALLHSLIENLHRKDLSLEERVEGYKELQFLDPAKYGSLSALARKVVVSHQKLTEDYQAYAVLLKLRHRGISLASHLPPSAEERQQGKVLPEYHAVLVAQTISYLLEKGLINEADAEEKLVELAEAIAPLSQAQAKDWLQQVRADWEAGEPVINHSLPVRFGAARRGLSRRHGKGSQRAVQVGGSLLCRCCNRAFELVHSDDVNHWLRVVPVAPTIGLAEAAPGLGLAAEEEAPQDSERR